MKAHTGVTKYHRLDNILLVGRIQQPAAPPIIENPLMYVSTIKLFFQICLLSHDLCFSIQKQRSRLTGACKTLGSKTWSQYRFCILIRVQNYFWAIFSNKAISSNGLCKTPDFSSSSDLKLSSLNLHLRQTYKRLAFLSEESLNKHHS